MSPCGGDSVSCVPLPAVLLTRSQLRGRSQSWEAETKAGLDPPWPMAPGSALGAVGTLLQDGWGGRMGKSGQGGGSRHQSWGLILYWSQTAIKGFDLRLPGSVHISRRSGRL